MDGRMLLETGAGLVLDPHDVPRSAALLQQRIRDETGSPGASVGVGTGNDEVRRDKLARQLEDVLLRTTGCEKRKAAPDGRIAAGRKLG